MENYNIEYYTVKSKPSFSEYSLQYLKKMTVVYYGPPFASHEDGVRIMRSIFAEYLGEVAVIEGRSSEPASLIVKMVDGELVVLEPNALEIQEIEKKIAERNEAARTKHLIELYEKLNVEDRVKVVAKMIGGTEHDC